MMLRTDADHLPAPIHDELLDVATILFEAFEETTKGRCSEHFRAGRILTLILHGPQAEKDWEEVAPGEAFRLLAIVNYPRLARSERDWRLVRDRLRRAWEHGEIARPVRLSVESLERLNGALVEGVPHFVTIAEQGIALYQMEGLRLKSRAVCRCGNGLFGVWRSSFGGMSAAPDFWQALLSIGTGAMGRWRR